MNSLADSCKQLKDEYDACFNTWFSEHFLRGDTNDSMCAPMFKSYQQCVKKAMKDQKIEVQEVERDLLGTEQERQKPQQQQQQQRKS